MKSLIIKNIKNNEIIEYGFTKEDIKNNNILKLLFNGKNSFVPYYIKDEIFQKIKKSQNINTSINFIKNNEIIDVNDLENLSFDSREFINIFLDIHNYYEHDSEYEYMKISKEIIEVYNKWLKENIQDRSIIDNIFQSFGDSQLSKFWKNIIKNKVEKYPYADTYLELYLERKYIYCRNNKEKDLLNKLSLGLFNSPLYDRRYNYFEFNVINGKFESSSRDNKCFNEKQDIVPFSELNKGNILVKCKITFEPIKDNFIQATSYNKSIHSYCLPNEKLKISKELGIEMIKKAIKEQKPKGTCFVYVNNKQVVEIVHCGDTAPLLVNVDNVTNNSEEGILEVTCFNTGKGALSKYWYYQKLVPKNNNKLFLPDEVQFL